MEETSVTTLNPVVVWALSISAVTAALAVLWKIIQGIQRIIFRIDEFLDDWNGVPERPGRVAQPGVMPRLDSIENELKRDPRGESLRDAVNRIEERVTPND